MVSSLRCNVIIDRGLTITLCHLSLLPCVFSLVLASLGNFLCGSQGFSIGPFLFTAMVNNDLRSHREAAPKSESMLMYCSLVINGISAHLCS